MEFTNEFRVPSDIETTFATLTDLERVAPCLPGATLEEVDGDTYSGKVRVKVGPVTVTYAGMARLTEADSEAKRGRIEAAGRETRGSGSAKADVVATLAEDGSGTRVTVVTELAVTGKPAQFGRGAMADVGARIIDTFADRLRTMMEEDDARSPAASEQEPAEANAESPSAAGAGSKATGLSEVAPATTGGAVATSTSGPRRIESHSDRENDALDLMDVAGPAAIKRLAPLVVALGIALLIRWGRQR